MKYFIALTFLSLSLQTPAQIDELKSLAEAKQSIQALIRPLIPSKHKVSTKTKGFRVDQCEQHKINWTDVLLMRKNITLEYKFKEGCDIQGSIAPKVFSPFPAELNLRNLKHYSKIMSQNKITSTFESNPIMKLEILSGVLTGPQGDVKFDGHYQVQIDPTEQKSPVKRNLGGEIRITEIFGKKVSIKQPIRVE